MTVDLNADLVRELLREQHPDLAGLPVRLGARGWDNQLWRLGDELAVRLPWATDSADDLLRKEHAWVPALAPRLPLPVPVPQRLGEPSARFPRPWLVTTWVPGVPADREPIKRGAQALAAFLTALHQPAPDHAPEGRDRGGELAGFTGGVHARLGSAPRGLLTIWEDAVAAPPWTGPRLWLHGDLHPANVLTTDGEPAGVIDFGDLFAGDPAYDLAAAWILLPDDEIDPFFAAYRPAPDAATLRRARGWAVVRALACLGIAEAGPPGGKPTWGPPARAGVRRLLGL